MLRAKCCGRSDLAHSTSDTPLSRCTSGTSTPLFHDFRNFASRVRGCNLGLKCAHAQLEWCTARTGRKASQTCLKPPRKPLLKSARIEGVIRTCKALRAFP